MTPTVERRQTGKRPYLRPADRRRHLLDATARVFGRSGLAGITVVAVAAEAGVSRRLVYDHFEDLAALLEAFFEERLAVFIDAVDRSAGGVDVEPSGTLAAGLREMLARPPADLAAVDLIVRGTGVPELERLRRRLRAHLEERWLPVVDPGRTDPELGGVLLWAVLGGVLALAGQVSAGRLDADRATALAMALLAHTPTVLADASARPESTSNR